MSLLRRLSWSTADQGVSSAGNLLLSICVARGVSVREFGGFGVAFAVYLVVLGVTRALAGEPALLRSGDWTAAEARIRCAATFWLAVLLALVTSVLILGAAWCMPKETQRPLLALAVCL